MELSWVSPRDLFLWLLRSDAKPCNLSTCRYALQFGSEILPGCSSPSGGGMLVDFDLITRAQKGDSAAFNEIVLAYRKRILGTITRLIARPEDVEDVAQEAFLRRSMKSFWHTGSVFWGRSPD